MSEYATDVDRYFVDLEEQLSADGLDKGSDVAKTLRRLKRALKKDEFSLAAQPAETETTAPPKKKRRKKTTAAAAAVEATDYVVRAFRVGNTVDADVVNTVFTEIDGWKTQTVDVKGRTFVVVTNAPRFSKKRIKAALTTLIQERREATA